jgi:hypothetical protein
MQLTGPDITGQILGIGATPVQLVGNSWPLNTGLTVRALGANGANLVYVAAQNPATATAWASGTVYAAGAKVLNNGCVYVCTVGGTSAGSGGPTGLGNAIVDNTATWSFASLHTVNATNGYELAAKESHLFTVPDASLLWVVGSTTGLGVCVQGS